MGHERPPSEANRKRHLARIRKYYPKSRPSKATGKKLGRAGVTLSPEVIARLGNVPDHELALEVGVLPTTIGTKRRALGIESYAAKRLLAIKNGLPGYHRGGRKKSA